LDREHGRIFLQRTRHAPQPVGTDEIVVGVDGKDQLVSRQSVEDRARGLAGDAGIGHDAVHPVSVEKSERAVRRSCVGDDDLDQVAWIVLAPDGAQAFLQVALGVQGRHQDADAGQVAHRSSCRVNSPLTNWIPYVTWDASATPGRATAIEGSSRSAGPKSTPPTAYTPGATP